MTTADFITGNTFPMNLIRRKVTIQPLSMEEYCRELASGKWASFWGHDNTLAAAKAQCGFDLTPKEERPALTVDKEGFPVLYGTSYKKCYVLTPEYRAGFRPAMGEEVQMEDIYSWHVLEILWE